MTEMSDFDLLVLMLVTGGMPLDMALAVAAETVKQS